MNVRSALTTVLKMRSVLTPKEASLVDAELISMEIQQKNANVSVYMLSIVIPFSFIVLMECKSLLSPFRYRLNFLRKLLNIFLIFPLLYFFIILCSSNYY